MLPPINFFVTSAKITGSDTGVGNDPRQNISERITNFFSFAAYDDSKTWNSEKSAFAEAVTNALRDMEINPPGILPRRFVIDYCGYTIECLLPGPQHAPTAPVTLDLKKGEENFTTEVDNRAFNVISTAILLRQRGGLPSNLPPLNEQQCMDLREANFSGLNLTGVDMFEADLSGANLSDADLSSADLGSADLNNANLIIADLSNANLSNASLSGAKLSDADLNNANLFMAYLSEANLAGANLAGANLSHANLFMAYLREADLSNANLSNASLSGAKLSDAYLSHANLFMADLSNANLAGANLSHANLSGVVLSLDQTIAVFEDT